MERSNGQMVSLGLLVMVLGCGGRASPGVEVAPVEAKPMAEARPEPEARTDPPAEARTAEADPKVELGTSPKPRSRESAPTPDDKVGTVTEGFGLGLGTAAPVVDVADQQGQAVSSGTVFGKAAALVVFYRGGWCPYCNAQLRGMAQRFADFEKRGVTIIAVSVDKADEAAKSKASWEIPFHVWSDPKLALHEAFKVVHQVGDEEHARLEGFGIDIEASSGETHRRFAVPSLFLVDKAGVVRWAHVDVEYKVRPTIDQVLAAIDATRLGE